MAWNAYVALLGIWGLFVIPALHTRRPLEQRGGVPLHPTRCRLMRLGRRNPWPPQRLTPGAIFRNDVIELASRRSVADWQHWMDTLLATHFVSGHIPAN